MGFFKKIEEKVFLGGKIIKDYGLIGSRKKGVANFKYSAFLIEKNGRRDFVLKETLTAFLSGSIRYIELNRDSAQKFKQALNDALEYM